MKGFKTVSVVLLAIILAACSQQAPDAFIAVNLVGYNTDDPKHALLVNRQAAEFEITNEDGSEIYYSGSIEEVFMPDAVTGDTTSLIDFSDFKSEGEFMIRVNASPEIPPQKVTIGSNVYEDTSLTAIQSYYYHRCGTPVQNEKPWNHNGCHINDAPFYDDHDQHRDVTGGWHDAGDYGKFSINTSLSSGLLLYLYEMRPERFTDSQLDIPEAGNGIPDLLDEVKWALDWLLKMQNENGGIFHKVVQKEWIGEFLPEDDPGQRYIFEITSTSTAGFAAVAALGAQLYKNDAPVFSDKLEEAALNAWQFLQQEPDIVPAGGFQNPPDVAGGEYGDSYDRDERLWASIELYKLTGDESYLIFFINVYPELLHGEIPPLSWRNFHAMALSAFLNSEVPELYKPHQDIIQSALMEHAERLLQQTHENNYQTLLKHEEYYWGSASVNLGYAYLLIQLYEKTGDSKYYEKALDQLHYTLGRNPFNHTFLTGMGEASVQNPYHQFSMELNATGPVPGMMVGGPNNHLPEHEDKISSYPGKSYQDDEKNFRVNETAINFTAIFVFVAGYFI
ncbi:MAG: glycoside hydrolase family 9 protein [Balneolaceae bacterium]